MIEPGRSVATATSTVADKAGREYDVEAKDRADEEAVDAKDKKVRIVEDGYVPSFSHLVSELGLPADALSRETVTIPTKLFRFLLSAQVRRLPFNASAYGKTNPDVAKAHEDGAIDSVHEHFVGTGWFENRHPGWYFVDERWYGTFYRDLALAQRAGKIKDLSRHYYLTGRAEGRVGSARQLASKEQWDRVLRTTGT